MTCRKHTAINHCTCKLAAPLKVIPHNCTLTPAHTDSMQSTSRRNSNSLNSPPCVTYLRARQFDPQLPLAAALKTDRHKVQRLPGWAHCAGCQLVCCTSLQCCCRCRDVFRVWNPTGDADTYRTLNITQASRPTNRGRYKDRAVE